MAAESGWYQFDGGITIGQRGSEKGIILQDEEHSDGARITLESNGYTPFAITCGIYGWMVHTRFFSLLEEAQLAFGEMKVALAAILKQIPYENDPGVEAKITDVSKAIEQFIVQFP